MSQPSQIVVQFFTDTWMTPENDVGQVISTNSQIAHQKSSPFMLSDVVKTTVEAGEDMAALTSSSHRKMSDEGTTLTSENLENKPATSAVMNHVTSHASLPTSVIIPNPTTGANVVSKQSQPTTTTSYFTPDTGVTSLSSADMLETSYMAFDSTTMSQLQTDTSWTMDSTPSIPVTSQSVTDTHVTASSSATATSDFSPSYYDSTLTGVVATTTTTAPARCQHCMQS